MTQLEVAAGDGAMLLFVRLGRSDLYKMTIGLSVAYRGHSSVRTEPFGYCFRKTRVPDICDPQKKQRLQNRKKSNLMQPCCYHRQTTKGNTVIMTNEAIGLLL